MIHLTRRLSTDCPNANASVISLNTLYANELISIKYKKVPKKKRD